MRHLRTVEICGTPYRVMRATAEENADLESAWGLCDSPQATIYIAAEQASAAQSSVLFHELIHACLHETSLNLRIETAEAGLEEALVNALTASLRPALISAGWREPAAIASRSPRKSPK